MALSGVFVTGTDTGVGKTLVCTELLHAAMRAGRRSVGMKPIASGATRTKDGLRNDDALALWRAAGESTPYDQVNPYCFEAPIAPHLAAAQAGATIDFATIERGARHLGQNADWLVVEGVGGWLAPLSVTETIQDLALTLALPVLLVVGLRLGCLNHAALSYRAICASGLPFAGWIGSQIDPAMLRVEENLATLTGLLQTAPLAVLGWNMPVRPQQRQFDSALQKLICRTP